MGTFKSSKTLCCPNEFIPKIAEDIISGFGFEGYQTTKEVLPSGVYDISVSKGGLFKKVLGMQTALKIKVQPMEQGVFVEAGIGVFGQQAVPTALTLFVFWPIIIPQIWGLIQQSKLDEKAIEFAQSSILNQQKYQNNKENQTNFCPYCGKQIQENAIVCSYCGKKL